MHIICPGWFGKNGPIVTDDHPTGGPPSHGICPVCQRVIDPALAREETMALEPNAVATAVRDSHDLELAAATSVSVLITAASEKTRRELAQWIHAHSLRRDGGFVVLRGDGATSARVTEAFARAGGGTLFVDALEQLRGWPQRRLLRLMEGDAARAAPGVGLQPAVRVVAGAGLSLWDEVVAHAISKRLFYRVNTIRIDAPLSPQEASTMTVRDLMSSPPQTCQLDTDLAAVTQLMWEHDCGVVPVVDPSGRVVGMITDRDICIATATRRLLPEHIAASEVMSRESHTCLPEDTVPQALNVMKQARVRRLPVIDARGHLEGVISLNDIGRAVGRKGGPAAAAVVDTMASICTPRAAVTALA